MAWTDRTKILLGEEGLENLDKAKVIIFGVGGVGGYVTEMLARTGVGNLTLVDFDVVSESNLNRQIIALNSTIGVEKVVVMRNRIKDINPKCNVEIKIEKVLPENIESFNLSQYDYVIDCIDSKNSKVALIKYCYDNKIKIISSMGAGNRSKIPNFVIKDIFDTSYDGLAKVVRKRLKELGVKKHTVVVCEQQPIKNKVVGSIAYYPTMSACVVASKVVNDLIIS